MRYKVCSTLGGVTMAVPMFPGLILCTLDEQQDPTTTIVGVEPTTFACLKTRSTLCPPAVELIIMEGYMDWNTKALWLARKTTKFSVQSAVSLYVRQ